MGVMICLGQGGLRSPSASSCLCYHILVLDYVDPLCNSPVCVVHLYLWLGVLICMMLLSLLMSNLALPCIHVRHGNFPHISYKSCLYQGTCAIGEDHPYHRTSGRCLVLFAVSSVYEDVVVVIAGIVVVVVCAVFLTN